jgi:hypothetical protein
LSALLNQSVTDSIATVLLLAYMQFKAGTPNPSNTFCGAVTVTSPTDLTVTALAQIRPSIGN